jgi:predicted porin
MKKSLLAIAAMTAFAGAAHAQSSVTVYGIYDGGFNSKQTDETSTANAKLQSSANGMSGGESASSRIGFKGVEKLDGDLSATFNLEYGFAPSTGTLSTTAGTAAATQGSESTTRTAIVGLASKKFGSINIGRQTTGIHSIVAGNVWGGNNMIGDMTYSSFASTSAGANNTVNGRVSSVATRINGMTTYKSPTIMGASLRADYANSTSTANDQPGIQTGYRGLSAQYKWGPITANAGTARLATNEAIPSAAFSGLVTTINAANISYSGIKNLLVQYTFATNKTESDAGVMASMVRAQKLSAKYQIGKFTPFAQYGTGNTQGVRSLAAANTSTEDKAMQVGVEYSMSKRTNLYAAYGNQERKQVQTTGKTKITEASVGLRHTF